MITATINCICPNCKTEFEYKRECKDKTSADNWVAYTLKGEDKLTSKLCTACFLEKRRSPDNTAEEEKEVLKPNIDMSLLPALTGGSIGQLKIAEAVRYTYLARNKHLTKIQGKVRDKITAGKRVFPLDKMYYDYITAILAITDCTEWLNYYYGQPSMIKSRGDIDRQYNAIQGKKRKVKHAQRTKKRRAKIKDKKQLQKERIKGNMRWQDTEVIKRNKNKEKRVLKRDNSPRQ